MLLFLNKILAKTNIIAILFCIVLAQIYIPSISFNDVIIIPDIILIFCCCIVLSDNNRTYALIYCFLLSFIQDMTFNLEMAGIFSFSKTICIFLIGYINDYKNIWSRNVKLAFISFAYFFNYLIFYSFLLMLNDSWELFFQSILFQTSLSFLIFYLIDMFIYNMINS